MPKKKTSSAVATTSHVKVSVGDKVVRCKTSGCKNDSIAGTEFCKPCLVEMGEWMFVLSERERLAK